MRAEGRTVHGSAPASAWRAAIVGALRPGRSPVWTWYPPRPRPAAPRPTCSPILVPLRRLTPSGETTPSYVCHRDDAEPHLPTQVPRRLRVTIPAASAGPGAAVSTARVPPAGVDGCICHGLDLTTRTRGRISSEEQGTNGTAVALSWFAMRLADRLSRYKDLAWFVAKYGRTEFVVTDDATAIEPTD